MTIEGRIARVLEELWPGGATSEDVDAVLAALAPEMAVVKAAVAWECADDRPGGFWDDPVKSPAQAALIAAVHAYQESQT